MAKTIRKANVHPSFTQYLDRLRDEQPLELVLVGHLVLEALLVELIQLKDHHDKCWKLPFSEKLQRCSKMGTLLPARVPFYQRLNDIRNDFAHVLGHRLEFDDVFALVGDMAIAGYDFSDQTVYSDRKLSEEWYGVQGVLVEVLNNLYFELAESLLINGGASRL